MEPRRRTREAPPSRTDPRLPGEGRNNKSGGLNPCSSGHLLPGGIGGLTVVANDLKVRTAGG